MEKRIRVSGYIDLPVGAEIPTMGSKIFGSFVAEVDGDHRDRRKRRGGEVKVVQTAPATMTEDSTLDRIVAPGPEDENQGSFAEDGEDE